MRVSNAERTAVADRLSKHYGDGRLDEEEFNERLDRAMKAKTQADLHGLFADLPDDMPPPQAPGIGEPRPVVPQRPRRPLFLRLVFIIFVVLVISGIWHGLMNPFWGLAMGGFYFPWLLIAAVAFFIWRSGAWHRRP